MSKVFQPSGQNFSGHVCMNTQQANFFLECNAKAHKIERKRAAGMLTFTPKRNPLLAERSPRNNFNGFDFSVPEKKPEKEKWVYPESDWGLMSKLNTQKHYYEELEAKKKNYASIVKEFRAVRERNEKIIADELYREKHRHDGEVLDTSLPLPNPAKLNRPIIPSSNNSLQGSHQNTRHNSVSSLALQSTRSGISDPDTLLLSEIAQQQRASQQKKVHKPYYGTNLRVESREKAPVDLFDQKISKIKDLGSTHPDVLAKWRAERAAEFVNKTGDASLHPPAHREIGTEAFRPGGKRMITVEALQAPVKKSENGNKPTKTLSHSQSATAANNATSRSNNVSTSNNHTSQITMDTLKQELEKTNSEIDRQRLKIALNKKTEKGFEKAKNNRVSSAGDSRY